MVKTLQISTTTEKSWDIPPTGEVKSWFSVGYY